MYTRLRKELCLILLVCVAGWVNAEPLKINIARDWPRLAYAHYVPERTGVSRGHAHLQIRDLERQLRAVSARQGRLRPCVRFAVSGEHLDVPRSLVSVSDPRHTPSRASGPSDGPSSAIRISLAGSAASA
ncbi:MAG: hypothetical protein JWQ07_4749 [Ramlibacter sp.]|nr:hypothetical protein [Ramlibacter sp.]